MNCLVFLCVFHFTLRHSTLQLRIFQGHRGLVEQQTCPKQASIYFEIYYAIHLVLSSSITAQPEGACNCLEYLMAYIMKEGDALVCSPKKLKWEKKASFNIHSGSQGWDERPSTTRCRAAWRALQCVAKPSAAKRGMVVGESMSWASCHTSCSHETQRKTLT